MAEKVRVRGGVDVGEGDDNDEGEGVEGRGDGEGGPDKAGGLPNWID